MPHPPITAARLASLLLLYGLFAPYAATAAGFLIGCRITPWTLPALAVATVCSLLLSNRRAGARTLAAATATAIAVTAAAIAVSVLLLDFSNDGQCYHYMSVDCLAHGWNPCLEPCPERPGHGTLWPQHYPKCAETMSALIAAAARDTEAGKAIWGMLLSALALQAYAALSTLLPGATRGRRALLAAVAAFPAIATSQANTYYIDWLQYFVLLSAALSLSLIYLGRASRWEWANVAVTLMMAATAKITFLFWLALLLAAFGLALWRQRRYADIRRGLWLSLTSAAAALAVLGFNPYVTNVLEGRHPLYPLAGEGAPDILTGVVPAALLPYGYAGRVAASLSSVANSFAVCRNPWTPDFYESTLPDTLIGGHGTLFPLVLAVCLAVMAWLLARRATRAAFAPYALCAAALFAALFLLPCGWWARYVAFFAAAPLTVLLYLYRSGRCRPARAAITALLLANAALAALSNADRAAFNTRRAYIYIYSIKRCGNVNINIDGNYAMEARLLRAGCRYTRTETRDVRLPLAGCTVYIDSLSAHRLAVDTGRLPRGLWARAKQEMKALAAGHAAP